MKISQTSGFSISFCQNGDRHRRGLMKFSKFWRSARSRWRYTSSYQVWQCSVKPFLEYGDLAIFKNGAVAILYC